jgi:hypothetical protein
MQLPKEFKILTESGSYMLGNEYEYGYLINKRNGKKVYLGDSYGDPNFGIIDKNEQWAILFGHTTYLWTPGEIIILTEYHSPSRDIFQSPFDGRQINDFEVEVLDDPWSDNPGIYNLNVQTREIERISNFKQLNIPYQDKIDW